MSRVWVQPCQKVAVYSLSHILYTTSLLLPHQHPTQNGTFVTISEPTLIHYYHPKFCLHPGSLWVFYNIWVWTHVPWYHISFLCGNLVWLPGYWNLEDVGLWRPQNRIFLENPKDSHCMYVDAWDQFQCFSALVLEGGLEKSAEQVRSRDAAQVAWQRLQEPSWSWWGIRGYSQIRLVKLLRSWNLNTQWFESNFFFFHQCLSLKHVAHTESSEIGLILGRFHTYLFFSCLVKGWKTKIICHNVQIWSDFCVCVFYLLCVFFLIIFLSESRIPFFPPWS